MDDAQRRARMTALARSFPTFSKTGMKRDQIGIEPFAPDVLYYAHGGMSSGEKQTVFFLLSVWNPEWAADNADVAATDPIFNVHEALGIWDQEHRMAFVKWAKDPWWP